MWTKAEDVPPAATVAILGRWDHTKPDIQRLIALQFALDAINAARQVKDLEAILSRRNLATTKELPHVER